MPRRKMLLTTASAAVLGLAALVGFADHNAFSADEAQLANTRAVSVVPGMKDGHPIASIDVLTYNQVRAIQQPLD